MSNYSRRGFLKSTAGGLAASLVITPACGKKIQNASEAKTMFVNPLDRVKRENIKITDIKVTPLSYVPPDNKVLWRVANYVVWKTDSALCQVFTDKGIVGIGEGSPYSNPAEIKKFTDAHVTPIMSGENPFDVDFLTCGGPHQNYLARAAWAGVTNACWDIIGKALNMPVYKILATDCEPDPHIHIYASGGVNHAWYENGETQLIEEALRYKVEGYDAFKFRNGTDWKHSNMTLKKYIPILRKLREAVGPDFKLMIEKQSLTFEEITKELCPVLEELKMYWYEEPIDQWGEGAVEQHLKIKEALRTVMISGGERFINRYQIQQWIAEGAYDIIQTDCNFTGISEGWHIAHMGHLKGRKHCPHNWHGGLTTIANAHLVAGIPNRHMLELNQTFNPLKEEIFKEPLTVKKGYMDLFDRPGFGVELIDDIEKKFPYTPGSYLKPNPVIG